MARIPILMPKMSMTMTEGEVSSWLAKVGDEIAVGDVVCEVMTDKVDMEVESTSAGTLVEIVADSGMVAVGEPIGFLEGEDDGLGLG
ncbi:MAG: biotin/lipoyl-containing protein, partial [Nocardioides sp.]